MTDRFFHELAARVSRGLLWEDKLCFAARLTQIRLACDRVAAKDAPTPKEFDTLLQTFATSASPDELSQGTLSDPQVRAINALKQLPSCKQLEPTGDAWREVLTSPAAEGVVPVDWMSEKDQSTPRRSEFLRLLVIKALRPDRVAAAFDRFHLLNLFLSCANH